ncbi:probable LRR receptor-like serine/threonine-protein kinase At4g37250 [Cornus florida]|uniref:probable LRR receptor-like serine/threonine-protein kinase At4g37250 n=1 Tax=Cornus florida TaxID=4283 RepID=UPI0028985677|nr:probable LRR receptor-like serine/threonine-protein kinase At4g37250 [Cornus florida]
MENLTSLKNLTVVSLRSNYFSNYIPGGFDFDEVLDLSSNMFNESLAVDFGRQSLRYLNLSYNMLFGSLSPQSVKNIPANVTIDLSFNNLTGEIPQSMALDNQKTEFFTGNTDFCGKPLKKLCIIPSTLSTLSNVITNNTSPVIAVIPRTIDSTPVTNSPNGSPNSPNQQQRGLNPGTIAGIAVGDLAGIGILAMIFLYEKRRHRSITASPSPPPVRSSSATSPAEFSTSDPVTATALTFRALCTIFAHWSIPSSSSPASVQQSCPTDLTDPTDTEKMGLLERESEREERKIEGRTTVLPRGQPPVSA